MPVDNYSTSTTGVLWSICCQYTTYLYIGFEFCIFRIYHLFIFMSAQEVRNKKFQFNSSEQKIFFTSDTHFGHANIIRFCNRPYRDVNHMNQELINNWNSVVDANDIVFHLGDFAFAGSEVFENVIKQLNGRIYWILGNHDYKNFRPHYQQYFEHIAPKMVISVDGQPIILNHEPLLCFGGQLNNRYWQLFGHVHTSHQDYSKQGCDIERMTQMSTPTMYDVGVDYNHYTPISFEQLKERIDEQILRNESYLYWWNNMKK